MEAYIIPIILFEQRRYRVLQRVLEAFCLKHLQKAETKKPQES